MALLAGTVSIAPDGTATKSDAAGRLYDQLVLVFSDMGVTVPSGGDGVPQKTGMAKLANRIAGWLVTELQTNAVPQIVITTSTGGLQRTPNPNNPSTATVAPAANQTLQGTLL